MTDRRRNPYIGTPCAFQGCDEPVKYRRWCHGHYKQHRTGLDTTEMRPLAVRKRYPAPAPGYKICTRCEHVKSLDDFYESKGVVKSWCKPCCIESTMALHRQRKEAASIDTRKTG